jgi:hypothetical protein
MGGGQKEEGEKLDDISSVSLVEVLRTLATKKIHPNLLPCGGTCCVRGVCACEMHTQDILVTFTTWVRMRQKTVAVGQCVYGHIHIERFRGEEDYSVDESAVRR